MHANDDLRAQRARRAGRGRRRCCRSSDSGATPSTERRRVPDGHRAAAPTTRARQSARAQPARSTTTTGYLVLTPLAHRGRDAARRPRLRRGATGRRTSPRVAAAAERRRVTVSARATRRRPETDRRGRTDRGPGGVDQPGASRRNGSARPIYNGYAELEAGQPGTAGPPRDARSPDLSNPAGGALEPQHFAYIIQWYLFALLALAAPFAMARAERKRRRAQRRRPDRASPNRDRSEPDAAERRRAPPSSPTATDARRAMTDFGRAALGRALPEHETVWGVAPNRWVEQELRDLAPGAALDLACGEGRNALWLARSGWQVTRASTSPPVAIEKARDGRGGRSTRVAWVGRRRHDLRARRSRSTSRCCATCRSPPDDGARPCPARRGRPRAGRRPARHRPRHPQPHRRHGRPAGRDGALHAGRRRRRPRRHRAAVDKADEALRPVEGADRPAIDVLLVLAA